MRYVYILKSLDKRTYIGSTDNLRERLKRHTKGYILATREKLPIKLVAYFAFINKYTAYEFEKYLKTGSGRAFIKKHFAV